MKKFYRDFYGNTASIRINSDGSAVLKISTSAGKAIVNRHYNSLRGARNAMGRMGDCWKMIG